MMMPLPIPQPFTLKYVQDRARDFAVLFLRHVLQLVVLVFCSECVYSAVPCPPQGPVSLRFFDLDLSSAFDVVSGGL